MPKFYTSYNRPPRVASGAGGASMTQQQFAQECDINYIVKRAQRTGVIPVVSTQEMIFGTLDEDTFKQRMDKMAEIKSYFDGLPAEIRLHYQNSVNEFIAAMNTEEGIEEGRKLGIIAPASSGGTASKFPVTETAPAPEGDGTPASAASQGEAK